MSDVVLAAVVIFTSTNPEPDDWRVAGQVLKYCAYDATMGVNVVCIAVRNISYDAGIEVGKCFVEQRRQRQR